MRFPWSTRIILAVGLIPIAYEIGCELAELIPPPHRVWDIGWVWAVTICELAAPIVLIGLVKLAFDNRPRRNSN